MQLRPNAGHQAQPFLAQPAYLFDLAGVPVGDPLEQIQFVVHQAEIVDRQPPGCNHLCVSGKRLSAQDDALVGGFWGHWWPV